jgi:hypothetical protein
MLKTLLASSSLAVALLFAPMGSFGPLSTSGSAGLAPAHAEFGVELGGITIGGGDDDEGGIEIGLGDDDEDGGWGGDDEEDDEDED